MEMDLFKLISHALEMGQSKGAYNLKDARVIAEALEKLEIILKQLNESKSEVKQPIEEDSSISQGEEV